ncbi:MAG: flavodoxin family protein [Succinivibrio sp.]
MKKLMIISSVTGNTLKVGEAVQKALTDCDLVRIEDDFDMDKYEAIIVGFWLDSGHIDNSSLDLIPKIRDKRVVLFGTLGGDPQGKGAEFMMNKVRAMVDPSNTILGTFWVQGKISDEVISLMYAHHPNLKDDKAHQEKIKKASTHPDENDLAYASKLSRSFFGEQ